MRPDPAVVLATDLDGTFLQGTEAQRSAAYDFLRRHRAQVGVVFVTGRELERVISLRENPEIPRPDHIIADVGTVAVDGQTLLPFRELRAWVEGAWGSANARVRALLADEVGIRIQPVNPEYRVSYYYEPGVLRRSTVERIVEAGFDCLLSDNRYLDVLPRGVAKGSMLLRLLDLLGEPRERVVVCGDTLNDFSLYETNLPGVAVGNAEPALLEAVADMPTVYHSRAAGVAGILEGLLHWHAAGVLPDHPVLEALRQELAL